MKKCNLLLFLLLLALPLLAQVVQQGKVRELSSNNRPVPGVQIIFTDAGSEVSDGEGNFRLVFQDKKPGQLIFMEKIYKKGFELVNGKDFEFVKISNTNQLRVDVILAVEGTVDAAKKVYYEVSDKALHANFNREKRALQKRLQEAQLSQGEYEEKFIALQQEFNSQKKSLDVLAEKFARLNFDDVEPYDKEALKLFQAGEVKQAIEVLESSDPALRTQQILQEDKRLALAQTEVDDQKAANEIERKKHITRVSLLADMYKLIFAPLQVSAQYEQLVALDSLNPNILIQYADYLMANLRHFAEAKNYYERALQVARFGHDSSHAYIKLGLIALVRNDFDLAEKNYLKSLSIAQGLQFSGKELPLDMAGGAMNALGFLNMQRDSTVLAERYLLDALELRNSLIKIDKKIHGAYYLENLSHLARLYQRKKDMDKQQQYWRTYFAFAKEMDKDSLGDFLVPSHLPFSENMALQEQLQHSETYLVAMALIQAGRQEMDLDHAQALLRVGFSKLTLEAEKQPIVYLPLLADELDNAGELLRGKFPRNPQTAIGLLEQAIEARKKLTIPGDVFNSMQLAETSTNLASLYRQIDQPQQAIRLHEEALFLLQQISDHPSKNVKAIKASIQSNLAKVYQDLDQGQKAQEVLGKAIGHYRMLVADNPNIYEVHLIEALTINGNILVDFGQYDQAEKVYYEALEIAKKQAANNALIFDPMVCTVGFYMLLMKKEQLYSTGDHTFKNESMALLAELEPKLTGMWTMLSHGRTIKRSIQELKRSFEVINGLTFPYLKVINEVKFLEKKIKFLLNQ